MNISTITPRLTSNAVYGMLPGVARRAAIVALIQSYATCGLHEFRSEYGLPVNNRHQWNTKKDPDLKYMLKKGVLVQSRVSTRPGRNGNTGLKHPSKGQTYLTLAGT